MARRRSERAILFPWERRGGIWALPWARTRAHIAAVAMAALLTFFGMRERERTGVRATRATLFVVREAIDAYRADHDNRCPDSLAKLKQDGYLKSDPVDAWNRSLELTCPGRRNPESYDLLSFGPSGDMRGLDRVQ
jgi:general secretion pathway protein G